MAITGARKIQLGRQSAFGTAVAATTIWSGKGLIEDTRVIKQVDRQIGILQPSLLSYIPEEGGTLSMDSIEANFNELPHIFEGGIKAATATADGGGDGYIYAYPLPISSQNTTKYYTIEQGDDELVQEISDGFVESFKISGNAREGLMVEAKWIGRNLTDTTFSGGASVPTIIPSDIIVFGGSELYIDAVDGTIGITEITKTLLSFELDVTTGLTAKATNETKDYSLVYYNKEAFSATLKLVYEHNSDVDSQRDLYEAATPRLVRLDFLGTAFGTGGTDYDNYTFRVNAAGVYTTFTQGDNDGNATVEAEMMFGYDKTAAQGLELIVVNELSSLP